MELFFTLSKNVVHKQTHKDINSISFRRDVCLVIIGKYKLTYWQAPWVLVESSMSPTLDVRVFDEVNQSPLQSGGCCFCSSQEEVQRAEGQIGLRETQFTIFVLYDQRNKSEMSGGLWERAVL